MTKAMLEHVNFTVVDPDSTAQMLMAVFEWTIRWAGPSKDAGYSVHVGTSDLYVALYTPVEIGSNTINTYTTRGGLNHIGILVEDLDGTEQRVLEAGYEPHSHQTYDPGSRFYFYNEDGIEFEVVSYQD